MKPEKKFNQEVKWVLERLKYLKISTREGEDINFIIEIRPPVPTNEPPPNAQESALLKLEEWKAIKIFSGDIQDVTYGKDAIYTIELLQPEFDAICRRFQVEPIQYFDADYSDGVERSATVSNPFCEVIDSIGYLRFNKHGQKLKIGKEKTRHFKLLQYLLEPIGVYKTIESVFEKIQLPKDGNDQKLWDANTGKTAKVTIIQNTIKELQKGGKLKGKFFFTFNENKSQIKAELK